jgi:hypothetical protein
MADLVIWKFEVLPHGARMPAGARVLSVGTQGQGIYAWALCDPDQPEVERRLWPVSTGAGGSYWANEATFVGTVQMQGGLVFHIFDRGEA